MLDWRREMRLGREQARRGLVVTIEGKSKATAREKLSPALPSVRHRDMCTVASSHSTPTTFMPAGLPDNTFNTTEDLSIYEAYHRCLAFEEHQVQVRALRPEARLTSYTTRSSAGSTLHLANVEYPAMSCECAPCIHRRANRIEVARRRFPRAKILSDLPPDLIYSPRSALVNASHRYPTTMADPQLQAQAQARAEAWTLSIPDRERLIRAAIDGARPCPAPLPPH